ncbi:cytochrome P450 [Apiospora arundinis]
MALAAALSPHQQGPLPLPVTQNRALTPTRGRTPYTDWYRSPPDRAWAQPAEHAYRIAVETLKKELNPDEFHDICMQDQHSIRDVQSAVQDALEDYETRAKSLKARKWLGNCSSRVKYYESVFDTLAQHYPEFTSLAWGTFKFLFTAVLNHEELLTGISKTISRIADLLPRTELHLELYPTERMRETVALLYAKIIEFALMAVRWFKKGKLLHSFAAIIHPYKLSFAPVVDEVSELSRRVDKLADAASKAEIHDQHVTIDSLERRMSYQNAKIDSLERRMSQLMELMIAQQCIQNEISVDVRDQKQFFRNSRLEHVHQLMLEQGTPDSESSLAFCRSMRTRRIQKLATQLPTASISTLKAWVDEPGSSLLLAESRGIRTSPPRFFRGVPGETTPWSDEEATSASAAPQTLSVAGILRSLVLQTLQQSAAAMAESRNPVTIHHLRGAVTIDKLFKLLEHCVSSLPVLFVVVDIGVLEAAIKASESDDTEEDGSGRFHCHRESYRIGDFIDRMSDMVANRGCQGRLKVVIAAVNLREASSIYSYEPFGDMRIPTDRGRQIGRLMRQPKYRGMFRQRNKRISEEIRTAVGQLDNRNRQ